MYVNDTNMHTYNHTTIRYMYEYDGDARANKVDQTTFNQFFIDNLCCKMRHKIINLHKFLKFRKPLPQHIKKKLKSIKIYKNSYHYLLITE